MQGRRNIANNNDEETPFPAGVEMTRPTNSAAALENDDNNGHILPNNFHNSDDDDTHNSERTDDVTTKAAAGRFGCLGSSRKYKWLSALIVVTFIICALAAGGGIKTAQDKKRAAAAKTLRYPEEKSSVECDTIVGLTAAKTGKAGSMPALTAITVGAKSVKAAKAMSVAAVTVGAKSSKCKSAKSTAAPEPEPKPEPTVAAPEPAPEKVDWTAFIDALNEEDTEEEVPVVVEYNEYGAANPRGTDETVGEGLDW
jgi:hypothetical protein